MMRLKASPDRSSRPAFSRSRSAASRPVATTAVPRPLSKKCRGSRPETACQVNGRRASRPREVKIMVEEKNGKGSAAEGGEATVTTPVSDLKGKEKLAHYNATLMEDIRSAMKQVIESVDSSNGQVRKEMSEFRVEVNGRFEIVEKAIKSTNNKIDSANKSLTEKIDSVDKKLTEKIDSVRTELKGEIAPVRTELKTDMKNMETRLSEKIDSIHTRIDDHDVRIGALESAR